MSLRTRARGAELMDEPDADPETLERSLRDLRRVNRWLGGRRSALHLLDGLLQGRPPGRYRLLDVATGSGDLPLAFAARARRRGYRVEVAGLDLHPATAGVARIRGGGRLAVVVGDALRIPVADRSVDFVLCSTALHHFDGEDAVEVVRELDRVARHGFVVGDLLRSLPAYLGARLLAATLWRRNAFTRHDGPLSVRRSFTVPELEAVARSAGLAGWRVRRHPLFRLSLVVDRAR
jgi:2-polyprenyl-3-methyl-5-hydroxy-6-metoxy-1,4-benzoquinol methylase